MKLQSEIQKLIQKSLKARQNLLEDETLLVSVKKASEKIKQALRRGKKVLLFGNGGSAADAQHFAAELVGNFKHDRTALAAISLVTDTSILSGVANDFGYEYIFSRQIEALGTKGDVVIAFTTSDFEEKSKHSLNIKCGLEVAKRKGLICILLCSSKTKKLLRFADIAIQVPGSNTQRIQEAHGMLIHVVCELIKNKASDR